MAGAGLKGGQLEKALHWTQEHLDMIFSELGTLELQSLSNQRAAKDTSEAEVSLKKDKNNTKNIIAPGISVLSVTS